MPSIQGQWQVRKTNATLTAATLTSTGANTIVGGSDLVELLVKGFSGQGSNIFTVQRGSDGADLLYVNGNIVSSRVYIQVNLGNFGGGLQIGGGGAGAHESVSSNFGDWTQYGAFATFTPDTAGNNDVGSVTLPFRTVFVQIVNATAGSGQIAAKITGSTDATTDALRILYGGDGTTQMVVADANGNLIVRNNITSTQGNVSVAGYLTFPSVNGSLQFKSGANSRIGSGTLSAGVLAVANTSVTSRSHIMLQRTGNNSSVLGVLTVFSQTAGVGFTVKSLTAIDAVAVDTSTFDYVIYEDQ